MKAEQGALPSIESPSPPQIGESAVSHTRSAGPWGFWATLGLGAAIAVLYVVSQTVMLILFAAGLAIAGNREVLSDPKTLESNGLFLAFATCAAAPVGIGMTWLFAWLRKGPPVKDYLALNAVPAKTVFRWGIALLGLLLLSDVFTTLLGRPIVPEFMVDAYQTAGLVPFLWLAVIVAAPLMEEVFFRGFLLAGFSRSKLGVPGAVVLTSILWAGIHFQYDFYGKATIFVFGLLLGYARLRSGSIYTTIILHALMNLGATIQVAVLVRFLGDAE